MQWLSDLTSNPQQRLRSAMSLKGVHHKNGGAPSRQLRRGIEPRLHKLRQKKQNTSGSAEAHKKQNKNTETKTNDKSEKQPQETDTPAQLPRKLNTTDKRQRNGLPLTAWLRSVADTWTLRSRGRNRIDNRAI